MAKDSSDLGRLVVANNQGAFIPNWGGAQLRTANTMSNVKYFPQRWQSPLLSWTNYYIPWDRATLFQWVRHYDTFHPLIGSCIDLHSQLPLSRFGLRGVKDEKVLAFYEEMLDEMDAYVMMYGMLREWWLLGEVFTYLVWDDSLGMFTRGRILPPEYIDVKGHSLVTGAEDPYEYYLIPDDELKMFIMSTDEASERKKQQMPQEVIDAVTQGKNIQINPFNLMVMMKKQAEYNPRGTSIVLRALKDLLYEDKIREAQYAIADRCVLPKEIWKIGDKDYLPSAAKLKAFAELIRQLEDMPKFNLVTHYAVNYEVIGAVGKFPNLASEFDWVEKRVLTAMFTNKALTTGEGPTYANASVAMRALNSRYMEARSRLEQAWIQHVFLPVAIVNEFYKITPADLGGPNTPLLKRPLKDREPLIPEFDWRYKANLLDDASFREILVRLREKRVIPMRLLFEMWGLDYDTIMKWLEEEQGTLMDPDYSELYRKQLLKEGINPEEVPGYPSAAAFAEPGMGTVPATASLDKDTIRKQLPKEEKKDRREVEKGDPEEKEELKFPRKEWTWASRGDILRKVEAAKILVNSKKEGPVSLDKIDIRVAEKNNIQKVPEHLEKELKTKGETVVVSGKFVRKAKKDVK